MFRRTFLKLTALTGLGLHLPWGTDLQASRSPETGNLGGESVQDLIMQIRRLEGDGEVSLSPIHSKPIIYHILGHIRTKLLLAGMICRFKETDGRERFCVLLPRDFELMTFSGRSLEEVRETLTEEGFGKSIRDIKSIPHARTIF